MRTQINYIFRKRLPQYHSIEELFNNISSQLAESFGIGKLEMPESGASLKSIFKNFRFIKPEANTIYHVTGDVNYVCLKLGKSAVLTVHDVHSALAGNWIKRHIVKWLWFKWPARRVGVITVISDFTKSELSKIIPNQAYKIRVIPNPINRLIEPDLGWKFNSNKPRILLLGTKSNKNLERTLEAFKNLKVQLLIIGSLTEDQENLLKELKLEHENYVSLNFEKVIECYQRSDLLCFASLYEGFGMPIIEAQGIGRPVITANIGAMKEVARNSACLVDPYDINDIRNGVIKVINDPNYRSELVSLGFKNVERFQLKIIAKQYKEIYDEITKL